MELHLKIAGILLLILAMIHPFFPAYFNWKKDLSPLSVINRQMMYIHLLFIALVIFLMGLLCLTSSNELLTTAFGKRISLGLAVFWTSRLVIQFIGYSSKNWKGKPFETGMHVLFSLLWVYLSTVFILAYLD